jgi:hypothetical protein
MLHYKQKIRQSFQNIYLFFPNLFLKSQPAPLFLN